LKKEIYRSNQFKRDVRLAVRRGKNMDLLEKVLSTLIDDKPLDSKYRDHPLRGHYVGRRECHIEPDWLLIYKVDLEKLILERTGSHADLFE